MKRKGLSQILYLIIAASVLMMIAMVITFTATDIIGGAGGQATNNACSKALEGKCLSTNADFAQVPISTCVSEGQFVTNQPVYQGDGNGGPPSSTGSSASYSPSSTTTYWVSCN